jgi:D-alanyl-lipoteichoic acid acyltransferase DltB (MBOAT superfamily)
MEVMGHFLYFNSIATNKLLTNNLYDKHVQPLDVATCGWWVLASTWLKFTVIWRFFRLAALLEGIDPPENMRRCFAMNYEVQGFWKNWHASFNRWLVKYMYIPAGGSKYQLLMVWPIFIFVALWHDVEVRLLGWAGLMIVAFLPELLVKREFARSRWDWVRTGHETMLGAIKGIAATVTISSLMIGNMVGFVVGLDGMDAFLRQLFASPVLITASLVSFFCAAKLMFVLEPRLYRAQ